MPQQQRSIEDILLANGYYPPEAFAFVQRGLAHTVEKLGRQDRPEGERHVTGQELCHGLRELALREWGQMARTVLKHLHIGRTDDFGKIVFYLIDHSLMQKRPEDTVEDFCGVYDFAAAFDADYQIDLSNLKEKAAE
ncbi:MAG: hypothetical protein PHU85_16500 [Phycisphaerae bacterium]|nr:hypothetical protein [Phycisphaerae bacterium]